MVDLKSKTGNYYSSDSSNIFPVSDLNGDNYSQGNRKDVVEPLLEESHGESGEND